MPRAGKMPASPAAMSKSRILGVFHRTQKGFGFVRPQAPSHPGAANSIAIRSPRRRSRHCRASAAGVQDIYIPRKYTGDAASGDLVLVQLQRGGGAPLARAARREPPARPAGKNRRSRRSADAAVRGPAISSPAGRATSRSTARSSRSRSASAIRAPRARGRTTRWSSKWSASPRPPKTAKA